MMPTSMRLPEDELHVWHAGLEPGPVSVRRMRSLLAQDERERADSDFERLADRFFSPAEAAALRGLPEHQRAAAFLRCWTRKEAFIKARGDGLSLALDSFDVTLVPGQPAAVTRTAWSSEEPTQWSLRDLSDAERGTWRPWPSGSRVGT